jgi:hypothetical protein
MSRSRRHYEKEHRAIEAMARAMAERAYSSDRWQGIDALDPSIMAYWRAQAALALDVYLSID